MTLAFVGMFGGTPTPLEALLIAEYAMLMLAVCLSACIVPHTPRTSPSSQARSCEPAPDNASHQQLLVPGVSGSRLWRYAVAAIGGYNLEPLRLNHVGRAQRSRA